MMGAAKVQSLIEAKDKTVAQSSMPTIPRCWITERPSLGTAGNVTERMRRFESIASRKLEGRLRNWKALDF